MVGVLFGVVICGVGVVLSCALAAIFSGTWVVLGNLVFLVALFVGARLLSAWLAHLAEQRLLRREMRDYPSKRSEEHTSELQSLMRISYAVFCLKKKKTQSKLMQHKYTRRYTYTST